MSNWETLLNTALLGSERRGLDPGELTGDLATAAAALDAAQPGTVLDLVALSVIGRRVREPVTGDVRELEPCEAPAAISHPRLRRRAGLVLTGTNPLLGEWLALLAQHHLRVSDDLLPTLLSVAGAPGVDRGVLAQVAGPRGRWLARLQPQWAAAFGETATSPDETAHGTIDPDNPPDAWTFGTPGERKAWLTAVRQHSPGPARQVLAASWRSMKAEERQVLLEVLRIGASPDDQQFLEAALTGDRASGVRQVACSILTTIAGSDLLARNAARAAGTVQVLDSVVDLQTAPALDPDGERDTSAPEHAFYRPNRDQGVLTTRRLWLHCPLSFWTQLFGHPEALLTCYVKGPLKEHFWQALSTVAAREKNLDWLRAVVQAYPKQTTSAAVLPVQERDPLVMAKVRQVAAGQTQVGLPQWLELHSRPWPADLTHAVVSLFVDGAADLRHVEQIQQTLTLLSLHADPSRNLVSALYRLASERPGAPWNFAEHAARVVERVAMYDEIETVIAELENR